MKRILKYLYVLPALSFFAVVMWLCITNVGSVISYTWDMIASGYVEYTNHFEENLSDYLVQKYDFIELNSGLFRVLGVNSLNDVQKMKEGHLTEESQNNTFTKEELENLKSTITHLDEKEIGYLYTICPAKYQFYDNAMMPGYEKTQGFSENLSSALTDLKIHNLNLDAWFQENGWTLDDTYFRTDHHFRPEACFAAAQQIMAYFADQYGVNIDETMDLKNWNVEIYEDWFLGSHGRRTGASYGGRDNLSYIYPAFPTDLRVGRIDINKDLYLAQQNSVYETSNLEKPGGFQDNSYCLYMGGDYPQVSIRNTMAPNDKKIIVVGDSMRLPVECFLAIQFSELYHIDLRYYKDGTFLEYVEQINPDLVLFFFIGPSGLGQDYGVEDWEENYKNKKTTQCLYKEETLELPQAQSDSYFYLWESNMEPGCYEMTLGNAALNRNSQVNPESPGMFQQISLVDLKTNKTIVSRYFLADYGEPQKWLFKVPENPEANYAIQVYNGSNKYTKGNAAVLTDMTLAKLE